MDSIPVSSLRDRYQIGKTAIYDRLKALGIQPQRRGKVAYISALELGQLDELNSRLKAGEAMPNVSAEQTELVAMKTFNEPPRLIQNTTAELNTIALSPSIESAILTFATMLKPERDLLSNHSQLQRCADNDWLLSTIELRQLVGRIPKQEWFQRMGFTFTRCDREWKITRNLNL